jgi:peroxiredoxin Q/BCP
MTKELAIGDKAPPFSLMTDNAGPISSAQLKGKPFVLYFYPKDDTSGCTKEAVAFSESKKKFDALGVKIIGISKDTIQAHEKFRAKHKLKIDLGSDPEKHVIDSYGVCVEKSLYGRKYMGIDRATFLVDARGTIRQVWRKVRVPGHVEAVLGAAKSL